MNPCSSVTDEIVALVRGATETSPDLLGPVSEPCIARAEHELGVAFPPSFRAFLSQFGGGFLFDYEFLGLAEQPGHWLDIVAMNCAPCQTAPSQLVMFIYAGGDLAFYLDTCRRDAQGECAVVVFSPVEDGITVASSFLNFLYKAKDRLV